MPRSDGKVQKIERSKKMKRRKEIWPRVWMALLLWVLLGRAVVMPSFAAEEASPVGSADTDTFGEGYEEEAGEATESE